MSRTFWTSPRILIVLALACSLTSIYLSTRQLTWAANGLVSVDYPSDHIPFQSSTNAKMNLTADDTDQVTGIINVKRTPVTPPGQGVSPATTRQIMSAKPPATRRKKTAESPPSLDAFRAERAPILNETITGPPSKEKPVRIRVLLFVHQARRVTFRDGNDWAIGDEVLNICMDGWKRSPYFDLENATIVQDFHKEPDFVLREREDIVWVADIRRTLYQTTYTIPKQLLDAAEKTRRWQRENVINSTLKVVLMDYRDKAFPMRCSRGARDLVRLLGVNNVVSVVQQVMQGRSWNETAQFPILGSIWNNRKDVVCFGRATLRIPYTVRSDYAEAIQEMYQQHLQPTSRNVSSRTPVDTVRAVDVAHLWTSQEGAPNARLRNAVSDLVLSLNGTTLVGSKSPLRVVGSAVSGGSTDGRTKVSNNYAATLLTTKIVIVAQRDSWEDHYRLFEAICGGALVMSDPMITLPDDMSDGQHLVFYHSLDHLRGLLLYYLDPVHEEKRLQIARAGWNLAMARHRSYHWMEQLFFGRRLTP